MPALPALAMNCPAADVRPTIVIDTREQAPLVFRRLGAVTGTLQTGDYSFVGGEHWFAVERKSIADLVGCCTGDNRERFARELHRLRGFRFKRLLVVGARAEVDQHRYRSSVSPKAVMATLAAFEIRYDVPVVWCALPDEAAERVESWAWWTAREVLKQAGELLRPRDGAGHAKLATATGSQAACPPNFA